jgi:hypothetical protein
MSFGKLLLVLMSLGCWVVVLSLLLFVCCCVLPLLLVLLLVLLGCWLALPVLLVLLVFGCWLVLLPNLRGGDACFLGSALPLALACTMARPAPRVLRVMRTSYVTPCGQVMSIIMSCGGLNPGFRRAANKAAAAI